MLPDTTPTSISHPKQETPHCSTYSVDYHEKQTPFHYLTSRTSPTDRDLVNKTHFSKTHTSKVEDSNSNTSHKLPSPIPALPGTTPTSTGHPKQETPHCSTHATDYHEKQTPIHYLTSRTSLTDRDLANKTHLPKTHTSKVEDPKPHKKSAILVTSHKPPSPIHALQDTTPTSISHPKQETPHCSTHSIDYHGKQTSRTSSTDNDLVNKTYSPNSLNISERQFLPSVLTQSLIIPNLPISKSTVPSVASQSLSVPPPAISNIVPLATSQSLTLPHPPISNNPIPSVTLQLPYQATNVIPSNKSQQGHASHPFTTTSSIPPPHLASKRPDYIESGRIKRYGKSSSQSPPFPNKKSPVMKEVLSPPKADSKRNDFLSTPVTKESHSTKMNAVSKERVSNPEPQKRTDSKTISSGIKPLLRADFSENSSSHVTHTPTSSPMSVTSVSREICLPNKQYVHFSMKQNQKKSPTRQRVSQSQFRSINQQQSVSKNASLHHPSFIKERTHNMTLRSTSKKKPPPLSLYQKGKILIIV